MQHRIVLPAHSASGMLGMFESLYAMFSLAEQSEQDVTCDVAMVLETRLDGDTCILSVHLGTGRDRGADECAA